MKTCYGLQCYAYKEDREFGSIGPSSFKTFLVVVAIVAALFVSTEIFNEVSLGNYINSDYMP